MLMACSVTYSRQHLLGLANQQKPTLHATNATRHRRQMHFRKSRAAEAIQLMIAVGGWKPTDRPTNTPALLLAQQQWWMENSTKHNQNWQTSTLAQERDLCNLCQESLQVGSGRCQHSTPCLMGSTKSAKAAKALHAEDQRHACCKEQTQHIGVWYA
ncbi:hypothetical protein BD289DRAFT_233866 [Coniella lustricola]|uniref:Uncharacterized protein n=1 Tax=Coniella lustricola TaxID=2025994 RepID=A0A2T3AA46_9PEZI|nr:hypothetical protein BD289DRAFT_233866 [Coniella lustricola]